MNGSELDADALPEAFDRPELRVQRRSLEQHVTFAGYPHELWPTQSSM